MVKQGTMINVKKALGIALAFMVVDLFYPLAFTSSLNFLHAPIMAVSAFFLLKSGVRR